MFLVANKLKTIVYQQDNGFLFNHIIEYYTAFKMSEIGLYIFTWINFRNIINEENKLQNGKLYSVV